MIKCSQCKKPFKKNTPHQKTCYKCKEPLAIIMMRDARVLLQVLHKEVVLDKVSKVDILSRIRTAIKYLSSANKSTPERNYKKE